MKILYVTPMWEALYDAIEQGVETKGMPGFYRPLKRLTQLGYQVDCYFIYIDTPLQNSVINGEAIVSLYDNRCVGFAQYQQKKKWKRLWREGRLHYKVYREVTQLLHRGTPYDFVYAHSIYALGAIYAAARAGLPCGIREYGVNTRKITIKDRLVKPYHYLEYRARANFFLITDDGTIGETVHRIFGGRHPRHQFYFWKSGVDRTQVDGKNVSHLRATLKHPALIYVARVTKGKRQDRAVELLGALARRGIKAHLYLVGQIVGKDAQVFVDRLKRTAQEEGTLERLHFTGGVTPEEVSVYAKSCDVALLMSDQSNMGNVFHELLAAGTVIVALNDGSLDEFIDNGVNGFLVDDSEKGAEVIANMLRGTVDMNKIREKARATSHEKMCTWDERVRKEIELIEKAVAEGPRRV